MNKKAAGCSRTSVFNATRLGLVSFLWQPATHGIYVRYCFAANVSIAMSLSDRQTPKSEPQAGWVVYKCKKCSALEQRIAVENIEHHRFRTRTCHGCGQDDYPFQIIADPEAKQFIRKPHSYDRAKELEP